jgi:hypothetical protein
MTAMAATKSKVEATEATDRYGGSTAAAEPPHRNSSTKGMPFPSAFASHSAMGSASAGASVPSGVAVAKMRGRAAKESKADSHQRRHGCTWCSKTFFTSGAILFVLILVMLLFFGWVERHCLWRHVASRLKCGPMVS